MIKFIQSSLSATLSTVEIRKQSSPRHIVLGPVPEATLESSLRLRDVKSASLSETHIAGGKYCALLWQIESRE